MNEWFQFQVFNMKSEIGINRNITHRALWDRMADLEENKKSIKENWYRNTPVDNISNMALAADDEEIDRIIKLSGYEGNLDPKTEEELVRYFGDFRNSKGFDIENDGPWVERWMHPVDHLRGPEAATIERCARIAVHRYNKGKKILKFDRIVKATLAIECLRVYFITLEAKEESKNETTTYQARVNYYSHRYPDGTGFREGFDVQIFRPKKPQLEVNKVKDLLAISFYDASDFQLSNPSSYR
ncbi:unnamed protein product [Dovyalis caffra]|uniref:Uncharacterized protein n=1 Tax=Dovyalis caffra TaxID=77055 RepID=A0AAV1SFQ2_9ROSI|nr:unnamed protein product [Dovyalis caffra]